MAEHGKSDVLIVGAGMAGLMAAHTLAQHGLRALVIEQQPVIVGGWVAFDGAVNYVIEVPVTERLVGSAASRVLKGTSIKIPVTGTVDEPRLDTRALQNMLGNLLKNAVGEQAIERVGGFLDKLRQELSK